VLIETHRIAWLFPALHGNCRWSLTKHGLFQLKAKAGVLPSRAPRRFHMAGAIGAALAVSTCDGSSESRTAERNACRIEYSSCQLLDFTRPAMQADLKKNRTGRQMVIWASMAMHSTKTTGGPGRNAPRNDAGAGTLMSH
jgi:hypothetical protein